MEFRAPIPTPRSPCEKFASHGHWNAELIDGKAIAATIRQETAAEVAELKASSGKVCSCFRHVQNCALRAACCRRAVPAQRSSGTHAAPLHLQVPGLAVVLVGSRKDSETYVRSKKKACAEVGIADFGVDLPEDAKEQQVLEVRVSRDDCRVSSSLIFAI